MAIKKGSLKKGRKDTPKRSYVLPPEQDPYGHAKRVRDSVRNSTKRWGVHGKTMTIRVFPEQGKRLQFIAEKDRAGFVSEALKKAFDAAKIPEAGQ